MPRLQKIPLTCSIFFCHNWKTLRVLHDLVTKDRVCMDCGHWEYDIEPGEEYIGFSDREWNMVCAIPHEIFQPMPVVNNRELAKVRPGDIIVYPGTGIVSVNLGTYTERVKQLYGRDV